MIVVTALVKPAGAYMARVFSGDSTPLDLLLRPVERVLYRVFGTSTTQEMGARQYTINFIIFTLVGTLFLYGLLRLQHFIPGGPNPSYLTTPLTPDLSANTAISFSTTTTWQAYGGENTMKYWTQLIGLAGQNFMAGASGLAIGIAATILMALVIRNELTYDRFLPGHERTYLVTVKTSFFGPSSVFCLSVRMPWMPASLQSTGAKANLVQLPAPSLAKRS